MLSQEPYRSAHGFPPNYQARSLAGHADAMLARALVPARSSGKRLFGLETDWPFFAM
jgi:hypothetical protein